MANEATIRNSLQIVKGELNYQSKPTSFLADVSMASGVKGPTPGNILAALAGTDVDLSALGTPGLCRIQNLDATNYVTYGIWNGVDLYPLGELLAGEVTIFRLARDIEEEYGTGTGTTGTAINKLRFRANTAACNVLVEAFEK